MLIRTERLIITDFDRSMIESVRLNSLDEDTRRFVPDEVFETYDEAAEAVDALITCYEGNSGPFVRPVLLKDGRNIGYVQAVQLKDEWEIGYHIAKQYTGKGYATEALTAFLPVIMKKLNLTTIFGICDADNEASRKVLEKCGFFLEYDGRDKYQNVKIRVYRYRYTL